MKVGFVGSGNMAAAMARGWTRAIADGADGAPDSIALCDSGSGRAQRLAAEIGGEAHEDAASLAAASDLVVLALKPAGLDTVAGDLKAAGKPVVSVLGATSLERLGTALGDFPVARVMPNVATEVRRGVLAYSLGPGYAAGPSAETERLVALLDTIGLAVELPDRLIDAATAVMGCSPAYVALFAESLVDAGVREGLTEADALAMVAETFAGTAELLAESDTLSVRRSVTSPGGSTAAGLEALERGAVRAAISEAVAASLAKMRG